MKTVIIFIILLWNFRIADQTLAAKVKQQDLNTSEEIITDKNRSVQYFSSHHSQSNKISITGLDNGPQLHRYASICRQSDQKLWFNKSIESNFKTAHFIFPHTISINEQIFLSLAKRH